MLVIRRILVPTLAFFTLAMLTMGGLVISWVEENARRQEERELTAYGEFLKNRMHMMEEFALALALAMGHNPEIAQAMADNDRERLLRLTMPAYEVLRKQFDIPQYQYHLPPALSYLRVHEPTKFGDDLSAFRATVVAANREQRPVTGLEIGRAGLGMRGVTPVVHQGTPIGTVEFGLNVDRYLLNQLKAISRSDWQLLLVRSHAEVATFKPTGSAGPSPELLLQASTLETPRFTAPPCYARALEGEEITCTDDNGLEHHHDVHLIPLRDFQKQVIAVAEVILDRTPFLTQRNRQLAMGVGLVLAVLLLGAWTLVRTVSRVLRPIRPLTTAATAIAQGQLHLSQEILTHDRDEVGLLATAFKRMAEQLFDLIQNLEGQVAQRTAQLEHTHRELNSAHQEMLNSIQYARLIQSGMLPKQEQIAPHLEDFFLFWWPRDIVGGDFYWFHHSAKGSLLAIIDCTGHGVPGALMTMTANAILNHIAKTLEEEDPGLMLGHANRILREALQSEHHPPGMDIGMEMALCHWRPDEPFLTFAGAGMGLLRITGQEVTELRGTPHSLGYRRSDPQRHFPNHRVEILPGSTFYLVSDGLLDQSGGPKGFGFGKKRLLACLLGIGDRAMETQQHQLEQALRQYQGERPQRDDITVIGFRLAVDAQARHPLSF